MLTKDKSNLSLSE